ncbi:MAG: hypothetical protein WC635_06120 [Bacteriovorax sp.]|jgi:hypothetical protein
MKELMSQDLMTIAKASSTPMISIYFSKESGTLDKKALNEKWKESLSKAEIFLLKDYNKSIVQSFMEPLRNDNFMQTLEHLDKGIIVFYSSGEKGYMRVQSSIDDLVVVADSFHIKPLIRIKNTVRGYFLVSISSKAINLWVETNGHLYRLETYKNESLPEDSNKIPKASQRDFIARTAVELDKMFANYKMPIILAGVKDHLGHMRKIIDHSMILENGIVGNVERLTIENLREKCFELLGPYYLKKELEAIEELNYAVKRDHAITYLEDIARSAVCGKIKKLFVVENRQLWGAINKLTGEIFISPRQINSHDDDILDDICQIVLNKGGEVIVLRDGAGVKGYLAAAIVSDRSHLYDFEHPGHLTAG